MQTILSINNVFFICSHKSNKMRKNVKLNFFFSIEGRAEASEDDDKISLAGQGWEGEVGGGGDRGAPGVRLRLRVRERGALRRLLQRSELRVRVQWSHLVRGEGRLSAENRSFLTQYLGCKCSNVKFSCLCLQRKSFFVARRNAFKAEVKDETIDERWLIKYLHWLHQNIASSIIIFSKNCPSWNIIISSWNL